MNCPTCNGNGHYRMETAPGEWRTTECGACVGTGTAWAAQLRAEYKRGVLDGLAKATDAIKRLRATGG